MAIVKKKDKEILAREIKEKDILIKNLEGEIDDLKKEIEYLNFKNKTLLNQINSIKESISWKSITTLQNFIDSLLQKTPLIYSKYKSGVLKARKILNKENYEKGSSDKYRNLFLETKEKAIKNFQIEYKEEDSFNILNKDKLLLIDTAFKIYNIRSFADLGGVWGVNAGYSFYCLNRYKINQAYLVDFYINSIVKKKSKKFPKLKIYEEDFHEKKVLNSIKNVDCIFLFDVLLHQISPDWKTVISLYAPKTKIFLVYNPQWIASFKSRRLLDLGKEAYFSNIPHSQNHPGYKSIFKTNSSKANIRYYNKSYLWQWGITDYDLIKIMKKNGFVLKEFKNYGNFGHLKNFENHSFVFVSRSILDKR